LWYNYHKKALSKAFQVNYTKSLPSTFPKKIEKISR
jgi:hypothetical protein